MTSSDNASFLQGWLPAIRRSEHLTIEVVSKITEFDEYSVFRSAEFPYFYGGNGIRIMPHAEVMPLSRWVKIFNEHFDPIIYRHILIILSSRLWSTEIEVEAHATNLRIFKEVFMAIQSEDLAEAARARVSNRALVRIISTAEAAAGLYLLHLEESQGSDWFKDEADFEMLFKKTIAIADGTKTRWLAIQDPDNKNRYAAALGFFLCNGVCRLQEVITAPTWRKRGLATHLLEAVAVHAIEIGCPIISLLADPEGDAHHMYKNLGFVDLDSDVLLMRY